MMKISIRKFETKCDFPKNFHLIFKLNFGVTIIKIIKIKLTNLKLFYFFLEKLMK
jgi:hypothetical protein